MLTNTGRLSWTYIIQTLMLFAVFAGVSIGALGYVFSLPPLLPATVLVGITGGFAALLIMSRKALANSIRSRRLSLAVSEGVRRGIRRFIPN